MTGASIMDPAAWGLLAALAGASVVMGLALAVARGIATRHTRTCPRCNGSGRVAVDASWGDLEVEARRQRRQHHR